MRTNELISPDQSRSLLEALKSADALLLSALDGVEGSDHALTGRDTAVGFALANTANHALGDHLASGVAISELGDASVNSLLVEEALSEFSLGLVSACLKLYSIKLGLRSGVDVVLGRDDESSEESDDKSFHLIIII